MGADDEARHHINILAQRLHQFGHRTKEREMELWHWLSNTTNLPIVECRLARSQELWETEYNKFIAELSTFVNKDISKFRRNVVSMGESATQLHGST